MTQSKLVVVNKNGKQQEYPLQVPDLYKIADHPAVRQLSWGTGPDGECSEQIIEAWHMLHDLVDALTMRGEARIVSIDGVNIEQVDVAGDAAEAVAKAADRMAWPGYDVHFECNHGKPGGQS